MLSLIHNLLNNWSLFYHSSKSNQNEFCLNPKNNDNDSLLQEKERERGGGGMKKAWNSKHKENNVLAWKLAKNIFKLMKKR